MGESVLSGSIGDKNNDGSSINSRHTVSEGK